ncbi:uncharacterized protein BJ171DRAFT_257364 [Polychytrium aggregatum]|uniref:uncharacterized protein n=1 Tax=Polychytrium aggregatum TaxID=110093 RepID=UPI0022FE4C2B|nr:uncharacterized protein BJ171DRAFT_257364 [Polychytrium aggregatum]KAI9207918.1 hypothetical protein BJ171DRAFT_257364 [Polychytrium aggregatum]
MMSQYQRAFSFIMKVLRCKHEVDNLLHRVRDLRHRADPAARDLTTKLLRLRHEAMVFSNGLLRYVMEVGVEVPWAQFASKLGAIKMSSMAAAQGKSHPDSPAAKAVQGLRDLYQLHEDYIADIHWRLFLAERQKPILTLIESLLDCVHALARECEAQTTHNQIQNWHDEFQTRMRMMVGILKKMGARASSRESECFVILKTYLDCNQFWG